MALTAGELSAGGLTERRRMALREGKRAEGVEVLSAALDLGHPRVRRDWQSVLDHLPGWHERRGIHREHAHALEGHRSPEDPRGAEREITQIRGPVHEPADVVPDALGGHDRHSPSLRRASTVLRATEPMRRSPRVPRILGWARAGSGFTLGSSRPA